MFTWWSDRWRSTRRAAAATGRAPSPRSRRRTAPGAVVVPLDVDQAVGLARGASDTALAQSARWTDTPRPRVTKPMISSPGTGVQQRESRTITSSRPSTCTPTVGLRCRRWRRGWRTVAGSCSSSSPLPEAGEPRAPRPTWPTRGSRRWPQQGVEVGVVQLGRDLGEHVGAEDLLHRQALAAQRLDQLLAAGLDGVLAALAGEPLADLVAGPWATGRSSASRATGRRPRPST